MANLSLQHIYKIYDNGAKLKKGQEAAKPAVSDFCMEIEDKEFIVFVGPSGCGKSTTLRMIAGLEEITSGELYIGDTLVNDVEPKDRDIAMVFQNYALYPHMTVYDNMAFGLRLKRIPDIKKDKDGNPVLDSEGNQIIYKRHYTKDEINEKVMAAAKILEIEEYLVRKPKALSGGQRQRVALGRAIVRNPKVFLLDEPLSNLDAKLRAAMRTEITKLHDRLQTTFIYVTHDQVEAMTMGSRIVVMKDGFIQQIGTPHHIFRHPANKFVASFIGTPQMNFFTGALSADGVVTFDVGGQISLPKDKLETLDMAKLSGSGQVYIGIRPDDVTFNKTNALIGEVDLVEELGNESIIYATVGERQGDVIGQSNLVAKVNTRVKVERGSKVPFSFDIDRLHLFDKESENSLEKDVIPNPKKSSAVTIEVVE